MLVKRYYSYQKFKKKYGITEKGNAYKRPIENILLKHGYKKLDEKRDLKDYKVLPILKDWNKDKNYYNVVYAVSVSPFKGQIVLKIFAKDFHYLANDEIKNK